MEFYTYTLPNGIRGIHRQVRSTVAHCALVIGAGSRDEHPGQYGLAHLTEHAFFKGTERRRAWQVNCRLENLGGELNAFTTKEETTIHATTLRGDFAKAAELIADIAFRSTFPEREIEREKEVIADEINTYKDSPAEMLYDTFEDMLFEGVGTGPQHTGPQGGADALRRRRDPRVHGPDPHDRPDGLLVDRQLLAQDSRSDGPALLRRTGSHDARIREGGAPAVKPFEKTVTKHTHQTHCIIGNRACGIEETKRLPLALLVNVLGGPSANSLLNVEVREKHGLSYNIEANYIPYGDSGLVAIYFSSEHTNEAQCAELVERQLQRLRTTPLTGRQLDGQETIHRPTGHFGREQRKLHAERGKSLLTHDEIDTMEEVYAKIGALTAAQLTEAAEEVFTKMSRLTYK